ncbi:hypothetical protein QJS04_geneDACA023745 [Acorus gramineus]|uniref:Methyltransferase small domain-containing protein n=1 Tax=Acorus gramineus TaxID=55184 RepID=A0AAV9BPL2_ACOGR|nr:hypothetical protein QJS04_geneDACA023745 [Acorus gramineus]
MLLPKLPLRPTKLFASATPPLFSTSSPPPPSPPPPPLKLPKPPLFLRPLISSATPTSLHSFHSWAKSLALSTPPDDPDPLDPNLLLRELQWLLQDATGDVGRSQNPDLVPLRADLGDLYGLWRERVLERRPFQYVVGCEHWRDLVLWVGEGVLIPRPETEVVVDLVKEVVIGRSGRGDGEEVWADLGTGSGAIAVGMGGVVGERGRVVATDLSEVAVEVARFNVERYGLKESILELKAYEGLTRVLVNWLAPWDKVQIRQGSWFEPLEDVKGKLTGLVSNPPYIPSRNLPGLQAEVGRYEPKLALDGGKSGMDHLIHLCEGSVSYLKPGGFFAFETNGDEQSEFLVDFMVSKLENNFRDVKAVADFAVIKRFVTGFRS